MADLTIAPASGDQVTTQNPQTVPSGQAVSGASNQSGGVQPGTANSLLKSTGGVSLEPTALTTVNLNGSNNSAGTQSQTAATPQPAHHANAALFGISIALVLIAAGLFWFIKNSAKSTTNY